MGARFWTPTRGWQVVGLDACEASCCAGVTDPHIRPNPLNPA